MLRFLCLGIPLFVSLALFGQQPKTWQPAKGNADTYGASLNDPVADQALKRMADKCKKFKNYRVDYSIELTAVDDKRLSKSKGYILVEGAKFNLGYSNQHIICDGKTLWNVQKEAKEVNVADYEANEQTIAPNEIFTFYQKGYKYVLISQLKDKKSKHNLQVIDIEPEDRRSTILKLRVVIDKEANELKRWQVFERGTNNKQLFIVHKFQSNLQLEAGSFTYQKSQYPGYKLIDLR